MNKVKNRNSDQEMKWNIYLLYEANMNQAKSLFSIVNPELGKIYFNTNTAIVSQ